MFTSSLFYRGLIVLTLITPQLTQATPQLTQAAPQYFQLCSRWHRAVGSAAI
jgi:hypothetical protein